MKAMTASIWTSAVLLLACEQVPTDTPLHQVTKALELVSKKPESWKTRCTPLKPKAVQHDCLLIAAEGLARTDIEGAKEACERLGAQHNSGECWFRLAEKIDNSHYCMMAHPFEFDCRMHLLSRWLFRNPSATWTAMSERASFYGIDPFSEEGSTVLYRHIVSIEQPMNIEKCLSLPNHDACIRAAEGVYRDRLRYAESQGSFPCDMKVNHVLQHQGHPSLRSIYSEFHNEICLP